MRDLEQGFDDFLAPDLKKVQVPANVWPLNKMNLEKDEPFLLSFLANEVIDQVDLTKFFEFFLTEQQK